MSKLALAVIALTITNSAAFAQTASNETGAEIIAPLTLVVHELDFGIIAPSATQAGTVTINRLTSSRTCSDGLVCMGSHKRPAAFLTGEPHRLHKLNDIQDFQLSDGNGNTMWVRGLDTHFSYHGPYPFPASGIQQHGIGATLYVGAGQSPGNYTGTFTVEALYQ